MLTPNEQWDLHNFYLVTQEMTDAELRVHRRLIKQVDPSLPQRAGRAYAKLQRGDWSQPVTVSVTKGRTLTVRSVVKPKPDPKLYAWALIQLAMERQGLAPTWTRPELDALLSKFGSDGRVGDTKPGTEPRKCPRSRNSPGVAVT